MIPNVFEIIGKYANMAHDFVNNAYKEGWFWYLLIGLIILFVAVIFFK